MTTNDVTIRVVLCGCQGKGGDPNSFRPQAHDKQWWGRRDALVRCVTSFLFGPVSSTAASSELSSPSSNNGRELVLLFDEDRTQIHMTTIRSDGTVDDGRSDNKIASWITSSAHDSTIPTEQTILRLWKRASSPHNVGRMVEESGIQCRVVIDPTAASLSQDKQESTASSHNTTNTNEKVNNLVGSKRQILEHIQKTCPLEFLKAKRLNARSDVILRKVNRDSLLKVWSEYQQMQMQQQQHLGRSTSINMSPTGFETVYKDLLRVPKYLPQTTRIVAGILHESCEEFPCFHIPPVTKDCGDDKDEPLFLCLFLGAVRDMTSDENILLQNICTKNKDTPIPMVGIRFGTVPEFTSKILSILAFHHARNVVLPSINRLLQRQNEGKRRQKTSRPTTEAQRLEPTCLNVVVVLPMMSTAVSTELDRRDRLHWCIVRLIVCTLWRSKMVSSSGSNVSHTNTLHLVFDDGICIYLSETSFVRKLASQHQAAPSEYQVLRALVEEIGQQSNHIITRMNTDLPTGSKMWSRKKLAKCLTNAIFASSPVPVTCTIGLKTFDGTEEVVNNFYDFDPSNVEPTRHLGLLLVMDIAAAFPSNDRERKKQSKVYRRIMSAAEEANKSTLYQRLTPASSCCDFEGASIMALQHFCYQNRVFLANKSQTHTKKRKKIDDKD